MQKIARLNRIRVEVADGSGCIQIFLGFEIGQI